MTSEETDGGICPSNKAICNRTNGIPLCISKARVCDGAQDCQDGHDEKNCTIESSSALRMGSPSKSTQDPTFDVQATQMSSTHQRMGRSFRSTLEPSVTNQGAKRGEINTVTGDTSLGQALKNIMLTPSGLAAVSFVVVSMITISLIVVVYRRISAKRRSRMMVSNEEKEGMTSTNAPTQLLEHSPQAEWASTDHIYEDIVECRRVPKLNGDSLFVLGKETDKYPEMVIDYEDGYHSIPDAQNPHAGFSSSNRSSSNRFPYDEARLMVSTQTSGEVQLKTYSRPGDRDSSYADVIFVRGNRVEDSSYEQPLKAPCLFDLEVQHQYSSISNMPLQLSDCSDCGQPTSSTCSVSGTLKAEPLHKANRQSINGIDRSDNVTRDLSEQGHGECNYLHPFYDCDVHDEAAASDYIHPTV